LARKRLEKEKQEYESKRMAAKQMQGAALANEYAVTKGRLESLRATATLRVSQVIGADALCYEGNADEPVFVYGIGGQVVDGDTWRGTLYGKGTRSYNTVLGAPKKVRAYTPIPPPEVASLIHRLSELEREMSIVSD